MKKITVVCLLLIFISCNEAKTSNLKLIADLPNKLKEVSGIAYSNHLIYTIEDSGNPNEVVVLDTLGNIKRSIVINDTQNIDWEDVTFDKIGNLYIGDFGNNDNERKDLAIYKIDKANLELETVAISYKITFEYPEQSDFPPKKKDLMFDVEAFFEYKNHFYLFTKNRSKGFDGKSYVYKIPNKSGHHKAQLLKTITTCSDYHNCAITSAAISPDGSKFVLLSHSKLWFFNDYSEDTIADAKMIELELGHYSQKEAIYFKNDSTLFIADERIKKEGGNLFEVSLSSLQN